MAVYSTDFSEYSTGSAPSDWTQRWDTTNSTFSVETGGTYGGNVLQHTGTADGQRFISWDDAEDTNHDNVDVAAIFRATTDANVQARVCVRGSGAAGSENGYCLELDYTAASHFRIRKILSGTTTTIGTVDESINFSNNKDYFVRFRVNGSSLQAKWWSPPEQEPSDWLISATDTDVTGTGWVGVGSIESAGTRTCDYVSIATNGDTPSNPYTGTAVEVATLRTTAVLVPDEAMAHVASLRTTVVLVPDESMLHVASLRGTVVLDTSPASSSQPIVNICAG